MIRFQRQTIYPGNFRETCFDYIPFREKKEWRIVLYFLKKDAVSMVGRNPKCRGIVLTPQLLPGKRLRRVSSLIVVYPDMAEVWELKGGTPRNVQRLSRKKFHLSDEPSDGKRLIISRKSEKTVPDFLKKGDIHWTFREAVRSSSLKQKYFNEFKKTKKDGLTPALTITSLTLSLFLLVRTFAAYTNIQKEVNGTGGTVKSRQHQIHILEEALKNREEHLPVNIYNILYRLRKIIDRQTTFTAFTFSGHTLFLSCSSKHALETVRRIKGEFGNVHISGITPNPDGTEQYTMELEVKR